VVQVYVLHPDVVVGRPPVVVQEALVSARGAALDLLDLWEATAQDRNQLPRFSATGSGADREHPVGSRGGRTFPR
jgi:hypothetical protein